MTPIPKETLKVEKRTWKYTNQSFADWFIYENKDDLALVSQEGKIERVLRGANKPEERK